MKEHRIFVFGSNQAGRHGKGAALFATKYRGAIRGKPEGMQGQSYAIPTKSASLQPLPLDTMWQYVFRFRKFAEHNPHLHFQLTPIGCGLAGYSYDQVAWMFDACADNIDLPTEFENLLTLL